MAQYYRAHKRELDVDLAEVDAGSDDIVREFQGVTETEEEDALRLSADTRAHAPARAHSDTLAGVNTRAAARIRAAQIVPALPSGVVVDALAAALMSREAAVSISPTFSLSFSC